MTRPLFCAREYFFTYEKVEFPYWLVGWMDYLLLFSNRIGQKSLKYGLTIILVRFFKSFLDPFLINILELIFKISKGVFFIFQDLRDFKSRERINTMAQTLNSPNQGNEQGVYNILLKQTMRFTIVMAVGWKVGQGINL